MTKNEIARLAASASWDLAAAKAPKAKAHWVLDRSTLDMRECTCDRGAAHRFED